MKNEATQRFYNLTVYCEGSTPGFVVDETTLTAFKKAFESNAAAITFMDSSDGSEVILRGPKLAGFKKSDLNEETQGVLRKMAEKR